MNEILSKTDDELKENQNDSKSEKQFSKQSKEINIKINCIKII